jgi:hypothetical protein
VRRSFDRATLTPLREMPSEDALALLAIYCRADPTFQPSNTEQVDITPRNRMLGGLFMSPRDVPTGTGAMGMCVVLLIVW